MTDKAILQKVLDAPMEINDANATTVREYLTTLLVTLWNEEEAFSGKRPFGNSDWSWDLVPALQNAGLLEGTVDTYGDLLFDEAVYKALVKDAIIFMGMG